MQKKHEEKSEERPDQKHEEKTKENSKEESKANPVEKPAENTEEKLEINTGEKTEEKDEKKIEDLPKMPMLPPILDLSLFALKPKKPDPTMDKLIEKARNFQGDLTMEVSKKYQLIEDKNPDCLQEAEATGIKPEENLENKTKCLKCEKMIHNDEIQSHINSHTSQVQIFIYKKIE